MGSDKPNTIDTDVAFESIPQGVLVITANRRLALELKARYNRYQASKGAHVWEGANIHSWSDWLQSQFQELQDLGLTDKSLLTPHQHNTLWEQIIRQSSQGSLLLNLSSAARLAQDAWVLTQTWLIEVRELISYASSESEQFLLWTDKFRQRCKKENWLDFSQIPFLVKDHLNSDSLKAPDRIILAGFDEITPQQHDLLNILHEKGCELSYLIPEQTKNRPRRFCSLDIKQEIHTAARWAIKRVQQNQEARIGIVVPKLAEFRRDVEQILDRYLDPISILPGSCHSEKTYNISLGVPLAQCPMVVDALLILRFAQGSISCNDMGRLLRSPFLAGYEEESERRARLDANIRSVLGEHEISLDTIIRKLYEIKGSAEDSCPILLNALEQFRKALDHLRKKQSPQEWIEEFQRLLDIFEWCRSRELNSIEFQQLEKFNSLFSSFQQLGQIDNSMWLQEATGHLHTIAADTPFHVQGGSDAPIQVVGILEATGLNFDHLWVIGLSDDVWPEPAMPNPLLPITLQRRLGLPHASPQRELEYATAITGRVLSAAEEVIVSHANTDGKSELRPSPLIGHLPEILLNELDVADLDQISHIGFNSANLEQLHDSKAAEIPTGTHIKGGSGLLNDQSACPFRAFATHRLGATGLEEPISGLDARIKGIITHRVLQLVWQQLVDQERLLSMDGHELKQLVTNIVSSELAAVKKYRPETFAPRFIEIEQDRLTDLILQWLELEKQRAPFKAVSLEQREKINLSGLKIDVRADRIDQLQDGTKLIIDYKTGKNPTYKGWFEQRIEEPQLPLYSTITGEEITGVCLAGVNSAKPGFKGVTEQADVVPGVKEFSKSRESADYSGWNDLTASWKQRLELLAEEILSGRADVMPKEPKVCNYCSLPTLCRIHEWEEEL